LARGSGLFIIVTKRPIATLLRRVFSRSEKRPGEGKEGLHLRPATRAEEDSREARTRSRHLRSHSTGRVR
jgi:hypothetical protein